MNTAKTTTRSALQVLVLLGVLGAGGAWGQAIQIQTLKTDSGCSLLLAAGTTVEQPVQWTGSCENGLAANVGILSYQFDAGPVRGKVRWHVKAMFKNGKQIGVTWFVADPVLRFQNTDGSKPMVLVIRRDGQEASRKALQPTDSLEQSFQTADAMINEAQSLGLPSMSADVLKNDIRQWYQNPNQYTGSSVASSRAAPLSSDDPKVFGRSARGG